MGNKFLSTYFRNRLISKLRQEKLQRFFSKSTPIGDWSDHLIAIKEIYPLYGSTTNNKYPPALFMGVCTASMRMGSVENWLSKTHIIFVIIVFIVNENCIIDEIETLTEDDNDDNGYNLSILLLPLFLSLHYHSGVSRLKENSLDLKESTSSAPSEKNEEDDDINPSEIDIAMELIDYLADKRFDK